MGLRSLILYDTQIIKNLACLPFLFQSTEPQRRSSGLIFVVHIPRLRSIKFFRDEIIKGIDIGLLQIVQCLQTLLETDNTRSQEVLPKRTLYLLLIQGNGIDLRQKLGRIRRMIVHLGAILRSYNAVSQSDDATNLRPRRPCRIEQRISGIQQIRMLLATVYPHAEFQHCHIKQHLHPIVFLRLYLSLDGKFVRFARLHFDEATHITLHVVQSPLYSQSLADIRRFQDGIRLVEIVPGSQECLCHRLPDMIEMHLTIRKECFLILFVHQVLTHSQFNRILFESLLHAGQIIRCFLSCIDPFIQEQIGNVTQQQRTGIVYRY